MLIWLISILCLLFCKNVLTTEGDEGNWWQPHPAVLQRRRHVVADEIAAGVGQPDSLVSNGTPACNALAPLHCTAAAIPESLLFTSSDPGAHRPPPPSPCQRGWGWRVPVFRAGAAEREDTRVVCAWADKVGPPCQCASEMVLHYSSSSPRISSRTKSITKPIAQPNTTNCFFRATYSFRPIKMVRFENLIYVSSCDK